MPKAVAASRKGKRVSRGRAFHQALIAAGLPDDKKHADLLEDKLRSWRTPAGTRLSAAVAADLVVKDLGWTLEKSLAESLATTRQLLASRRRKKRKKAVRLNSPS